MEETNTGLQTREELIRLANPFADLVNQLQIENGDSIQSVVTAGLYAFGRILAQTGVHIDVLAAVSEELKPLTFGYNEEMDHLKKKMI